MSMKQIWSDYNTFIDFTLTFFLMISRLIRMRPSDRSIPESGTSVSPMTSSRENLSKLRTMKCSASSDTRASGIPQKLKVSSKAGSRVFLKTLVFTRCFFSGSRVSLMQGSEVRDCSSVGVNPCASCVRNTKSVSPLFLVCLSNLMVVQQTK